MSIFAPYAMSRYFTIANDEIRDKTLYELTFQCCLEEPAVKCH